MRLLSNADIEMFSDRGLANNPFQQFHNNRELIVLLWSWFRIYLSLQSIRACPLPRGALRILELFEIQVGIYEGRRCSFQ